MGSDGDGNCKAGIDNPLSRYFFEESCIASRCVGDEIEAFTDFLTSELRFESIVLTEMHLMLLFMILQLGGIPNVRQSDGVAINYVGVAVWVFWVGCVGFQYLFTCLSVIMTVLATFALELNYSECMTEIEDGFGPGIGAGLGGAVGIAAGALVRAYLVHFTYECRVHTYIVAAVFYILPLVVGAGIGASWGAATDGSPYFGTIIPSLLCHPVFVAKNASLLAYVYTFSLGLIAAGFKFNPDRLIRLYVYVTVGPSFFAGLLFWVCSGAFAFSTFFIPGSAALAVVCICVFGGMRVLEIASGDAPSPIHLPAVLKKKRLRIEGDNNSEPPHSRAQTPVGRFVASPRDRSAPRLRNTGHNSPRSASESRGAPTSDMYVCAEEPRSASKPRERPASKLHVTHQQEPPPASTTRERSESKLHVTHRQEVTLPSTPRERPESKLHVTHRQEPTSATTLRERPAAKMHVHHQQEPEPPFRPRERTVSRFLEVVGARVSRHGSPPRNHPGLERGILDAIASARSNGMEEDSMSKVLLSFADEWVAAYRPEFGSSEEGEEKKGWFNPCTALSGSLWWLPANLFQAFIQQLKYDTDWTYTVEGNSSMFRIVLSTTMFLILAPCIVFGAWFAGYVYQKNGVGDNEEYVRVVFEHFFGVFYDFKIQLPSMSWFSFWNFDFNTITDAKNALLNIVTFDELPPIVMIDGSEIFSALSLSAALAKVIASFVGAALAALGVVERNILIGDVAKENATMKDIFNNHMGASHVILLNRLQQYGLKGLNYELNNSQDGFFVRFEVHTHVLAVSLNVFATDDFRYLIFLNLAHCPVVTGSIACLSECVSLEQLNLWKCSHTSGVVTMEVARFLTKLQRKLLYGCGDFHLTVYDCDFQEDNPLSVLDLSTMDSLSGSLGVMSKYSPYLEEVNLQSCVRLTNHEDFFSKGFAMKKVNVAGAAALETLQVFSHLEALVELNVSHCARLDGTLSGLGGCKKLKHLNVSYCNAVRCSLNTIGHGATSLKFLDIIGSSGLNEIVKFKKSHWRCKVKTNENAPVSTPLKSALGTVLAVQLEEGSEPPLRVSTAKLVLQNSLEHVAHPTSLWHFTHEGILENAATGLVLEVEGHHGRYKTHVVANFRTSPETHAPWQHWKLTEQGELESALRPGLVLTIRNGSDWEHAEVWTQKRNRTAAQRWYFLDDKGGRSRSDNYYTAWRPWA